MPSERDPNEIGALWEKESHNGSLYMTGTINGEKIVAFKNKQKRSDKQPDWRVLKSVPKEQRESSAPPPDDGWGGELP